MTPFPPRISSALSCVLALAVVCAAGGCGGKHSAPTVYAAASLTEALEAAAARYESETGNAVQLRFGGSGSLAVEIEHGAPADCFISADVEWMDDLSAKGLVAADTKTLLGWNHLVLVVPNSATASVPVNPNALTILETIAMGDPDTVPAGKYARQALQQLDAWDLVKDKIVLAHDVRAVLARVERREAEGGIVYTTDARASTRVKVAFEFPDRSHDPIVYPGAVLAAAPHPEAARKFLSWLGGSSGHAVLREYGLGGS